MENSSQSTSSAESDDGPDITDMERVKSVTKQHKGRVRFNSKAGDQKPSSSSSSNHSTSSIRDQSNIPIRPHSILRDNSRDSVPRRADSEDTPGHEDYAAAAARIRANAMADRVRRESPTSTRSSLEDGSDRQLLDSSLELEMQDLEQWETRYNGPSDTGSEASTLANPADSYDTSQGTALETDTNGDTNIQRSDLDEIYNASYDGSYNVPKPPQYLGGILPQLMKLSRLVEATSSRGNLPSSFSPGQRRTASVSEFGTDTPHHKRTPSESGIGTPERRKWYEQNDSQDTLATLVAASTKLAKPAQPQSDGRPQKPAKHKIRLSHLWRQQESQITVHIAGILARQDFILKLCRALMLYGAPTHRLEEYLTMTGRALEIECQFLYIPGCMIISFDDSTTHTTEVKLVRLSQGIDLGKLKDVHRIYKEVLHDVIGVEEATEQLDELLAKPHKFHPWLRVLVFGLTSVTAAPFSFRAQLIDLPLCFFFGCLVGFLQLIASPKLSLYSNVFEVTATVLVSFLARAFGSINGGHLFCFSALAQGGIVMLLPGYMFLSSSLELQAKAIVPGSIRIVYGVIYSLLLGFGITIGSALYGFADSNATSELTCHNPIPSLWGLAFVPLFVLCISILYQAKWKQMPIMVTIAFAGYVVNHFSSLRFSSSPPIASALGAFAVGTLANLHSRFRHGVAAAILIPAIFTQVPGGLASTGGLLSGMKVANEINNAVDAPDGSSYERVGGVDVGASTDSVVFSVAGSMVQIAIGITVGLFVSAWIVYPLGKRRSGLFSF